MEDKKAVSLAWHAYRALEGPSPASPIQLEEIAAAATQRQSYGKATHATVPHQCVESAAVKTEPQSSTATADTASEQQDAYQFSVVAEADLGDFTDGVEGQVSKEHRRKMTNRQSARRSYQRRRAKTLQLEEQNRLLVDELEKARHLNAVVRFMKKHPGRALGVEFVDSLKHKMMDSAPRATTPQVARPGVKPTGSAPVFMHAAPRRHGKDSGSPTVSRPQSNEAEGSKKLSTQSAKASRRAGVSKRAKAKGRSTKSSNRLPKRPVASGAAAYISILAELHI
jgi:hypothetical protein